MMKNTILLYLLSLTTFTYAQPKLVASIPYSAPKQGGSIFRMDLPGAAPGVIREFENLSPHRPLGGVCQGDLDWLYGMLQFNGTNNSGALYRIKRDGTSFSKLYDITASNALSAVPYYHTDGMIYFSTGLEIKKFDPSNNNVTDLPVNNQIYTRTLTIDASNWIYIMTTGTNPIISKIKTDGTQWTELHTFTASTEGTNGSPGITEIPGDSLFGVQIFGGTSDGGTIYSIKKDGTNFAVHHQFSAATGIYPESKLVYFDGKLYGTTTQGGDFNFGVLYTNNSDGTGYRVLHHFEGGIYNTGNPYANISISSNGRIFGSFLQFFAGSGGGSQRAFKVDTSGENFQPFINVDQRREGNFNQDILLLDNDETIVLTTAEMGRHDGGCVNQFDTSGFGNSLYHFGYSVNGFRPNPLIKSTNGKLYGVTLIGGTDGNGIIFSVNADGTAYTKLHEFTDAEGYEPSGKLLEASDGKLYGTCRWGGPTNSGFIYRIDKTGSSFQVVFTFPNFTDGYSPVGSLVEDQSGALYGMNFYSSPGSGSIFKINKDGTNYTLLKNFAAGDIQYPYNGLSLADSWLYGTGSYGGSESKGGIFRIRTDGSSYQVLHEFTGANSGQSPMATPLVASNGKVFGTTNAGGTDGNGILYRIDANGTNFTTLKNFSYTTDGGSPTGELIQASDGLIYGGNSYGGTLFGGTIFKINLDGSNFTLVREFNVETEGQGINSILDLNGNFIPLPVELLAFDAVKKDQTTLLTWKTAQEENNDHFEIERLAGGNSFKTIGRVTGAGNTNSITNYSFTDNMPFSGINYYRLKQIDIDGKSTYSKTVSVNFTISGKVILSPNPATDHLDIWMPQSAKFTSMRIVDISGKSVLQKAFLSSTANMHIDISHLSKGWYVLQLAGEVQEQVVFVKQ